MPRHREQPWPSRKALERALSEGKTLKEVAADFGRSVGWLVYVRAQYGLDPDPPTPLGLEGDLLALFLGSMLGDGSLSKRVGLRKTRVWFAEGHSVAQKGYVEWKRRQWGPWASRLHRGRPSLTVTGDRVLQKRESWSFTTRSSPEFVPWEKAFYGWKTVGRRAKRFPEEVLDHVSPLMVAVWYMDDGAFVDDRWPGFACHERSHEVGIELLRRVGIEAESNRSRKAFGVRTREMADRLLSVVEPFVHEDLRYKLDPPCLLNDRRRRVTWEVEELRGLVTDGLTLRQIERKMGWGEKFTKVVLEELDLRPWRGQSSPPRVLSDLSGAVRYQKGTGPGSAKTVLPPDLLAGLAEEGASARQMAAAFGVSESVVGEHLRREGIEPGLGDRGSPGRSVVDPERLRDLVGRGLPKREIARRLECSVGAVGERCKRHGLSTRGARLVRVSEAARVPEESEPEEGWRPVVGFLDYEISSLGRVRSFRRSKPRILRPQPHRDGTVFVVLMTRRGGEHRQVPRYVHHLVLEAFVGPRGEGQEARFLNLTKDDCRLENLVWGCAEDGRPRVHRA